MAIDLPAKSEISGVVFLDRDGVINNDRDDYVKSIEELVFLPGVFAALARLRKAGFVVAVVSNQACVAKGLLDKADLAQIDQRLKASVQENGGMIHGSYYCIHKSGDECDCRKPRMGLISRAREELGISNEARSYLVGDALTDIQAGRSAGCKTVLVLTGRTPLEEAKSSSEQPDLIARDLPDAVEWILREHFAD